MTSPHEFYGPNIGYVLELYDRFLQSPESVDPKTADFFRGFFGKGKGRFFSDQFQDNGIDRRNRVKAVGRYFVFFHQVISGSKEYRYGSEILRAGAGGVAVGGLLLQHENHGGGQGASQNAVQPGRRYGVGKVGNDFEIFQSAVFVRLWNKSRQWVGDGVSLHEVKSCGKF